MKKSIIVLFFAMLLCFVASSLLSAQVIMRGEVVDKQTRTPLPGVSILISDTSGTVTDEQGAFMVRVPDSIDIIRLSSVGYQPATFAVGEGYHVVALEQSLVALDQVIVSASRGSQSRTDAPVAITQIPSKVLNEAKPTSLDQVLNKVNGVFMADLGNEQHNIAIRQPLSYKSLFLYLENGIPIRPTGVFNHNALIEINRASLKTIEVIKGPASSLYGSEAIGGSINFITRSAPAYPMARLALQGDNLGYKNLEFEAGNTFKKLGVYMGGYLATRRDGYREHSDFHKAAVTVRADYPVGKMDKISTTLTLIDYKSDMTGDIDSAGFYGKDYPSLHRFTNRKVKALRVNSRWKHFWNEGSKTAFNLFYRDNLIGQNPSYRVRDAKDDPLGASGEVNENVVQSYGAVVQHTQAFDFLDSRLIGGVSMDYSPNRYDAEFIAIRKNEQGVYTDFTAMDSLLTDYAVNLLNIAAYAQFELVPVKNLRVVLATRYDRFYYGYDNHLTPDAFSGAPDARDIFHSISPKIGLTYDLGKGTGLYGNYSVGFVPPQVTELYRGVKVPVLEPSVYYNYEMGGWLGFAGKGRADISLYQMRGTNEIVSMFLDDGTTENRNAGETLHRGIEYMVRYAPAESLRLRVGGTNAWHKFIAYTDQGRSYDGKQMDGAPHWIANAEVFYYPPFIQGFRAGLEWQHLGSYFMDPENTERYEGFDVLNLRLGFETGGFETWLHVLNVTDKLFATNTSKSQYGKRYSPGAPRTFSVGIAYTFADKPE